MKTLFIQVCYALAFFVLASCDDNDSPSAPSPSTFVLVHGAFQAAFVWQDVKVQLEKKGQKVVVVELPGHGEDQTAPGAVSIDAYRDKVIATINPLKGKVVLVGHSMGGMVISSVVEKIPNRIDKLVYVAGFVPANGQSLLELASSDSTSLLGPALIPSQDQLTLSLSADNIAPIFAQDASAKIKKMLVDKRKAEPAIPFTNKAALTEANFGKADKYYLHTTKDKAIGLALQKRMASAAHILKTYSMDTGHSPFLSQPEAVTNILMDVVK